MIIPTKATISATVLEKGKIVESTTPYLKAKKTPPIKVIMEIMLEINPFRSPIKTKKDTIAIKV